MSARYGYISARVIVTGVAYELAARVNGGVGTCVATKEIWVLWVVFYGWLHTQQPTNVPIWCWQKRGDMVSA